ncbi:MAG: DUF3575 domain-containing protein [Alistipes sp.]|jgi:flagellar motor protein MotB|nr:DUF3575 domain-containing protein [Alistipes sp.]
MRLRYRILVLLLALAPTLAAAQTKKWDNIREQEGISLPTWNIKTNLLADLTTTLSLGVEFRTGEHTSVDIPVYWNPWEFRNGATEWRHIAVQPEFRYWLKETFRGHFFGLHAHYAFYNVGGLPHGPFTEYMHNNRFQGDLYGAGISWGHRWNFNERWGLEVTAGLGFAHLDYDIYDCIPCGTMTGTEVKNYFGPTKLGVNLIFGMGSKRTPVVAPAPAPVVVREVVREVYEPRFAASFITPEVELVKVRNESGSAYLEFQTGRSEILLNFRNNAAELERIHEMIRRVQSDADATITGISLVGHASPEGSYSSNMSLSQRRADALRTYLLGQYNFSGGLVRARGAGEDWATLGRLVGDSGIAGRIGLLDIINGSADYDIRDRQMRALSGGAPYRAMMTEMFPRLRRTDYVLDFEVAPITVERGREVMRTNPRNLSLNELFLIANTYQPGSEQFREVNEIAARTFPDSDVANNNAGAAALQRRDLTAAASYLGKVRTHDANWHNNMGVLTFLQGNKTAAAEHFRAAGSHATANTTELQKHMRSIE